jgi:hypothetical protein
MVLRFLSLFINDQHTLFFWTATLKFLLLTHLLPLIYVFFYILWLIHCENFIKKKLGRFPNSYEELLELYPTLRENRISDWQIEAEIDEAARNEHTKKVKQYLNRIKKQLLTDLKQLYIDSVTQYNILRKRIKR